MSASKTLPRLVTSFLAVTLIAFGLVLTVKADTVQMTDAGTDRTFTESLAQPPDSFVSVKQIGSDVRATADRSLQISTVIGTTVPDGEMRTNYAVVATPEPASMLLLGTGLAGIAAGVRRRMKSRR